MKRRASAVLALTLAIAGLNLLSSTSPANAIFNGRVEPASLYPFMVSVQVTTEDAHYCGGALITPRLVLTARHCFAYDQNFIVPDSIVAKVGVVAGQDAPTAHEPWPASKITVNRDHDIALITLAQSVSQPSIKLAPERLEEGSAVRILGYAGDQNCSGKDEATGGPCRPTQLRVADLVVKAKKYCKSYPELPGGRGNPEICQYRSGMPLASSGGVTQVAREGDSGGPVLTRVNGVWELGGVMVAKYEERTTAVRTTAISDWVADEIAKTNEIDVPKNTSVRLDVLSHTHMNASLTANLKNKSYTLDPPNYRDVLSIPPARSAGKLDVTLLVRPTQRIVSTYNFSDLDPQFVRVDQTAPNEWLLSFEAFSDWSFGEPLVRVCLGSPCSPPPPPAPLAIATTALPEGTARTAYSTTLRATGGIPPYGWSLVDGTLPPGLSLSPDGVISGTPTQPGDYPLTVQAADTAGATDSAAFVLVITAGCPLQTATGHLDTSFGADGKVTTSFSDANASAGALVVQADRKLVAAGHTSSGSAADFALARYNPDGTLDSSFGTDGRVTSDLGGDNAYINAVVVQGDGKLVAAGYTSAESSVDFALARYNSDGTLDPSFGTDGKVATDFGLNDQAQALILESDGRLVAAGFSASSSGFDFALTRYNPDGTLDPTFGADGRVTTDLGFDDQIHGLVLQADGKLVAGGISDTSSGDDFVLARYNSDGTLDASFGADGKTFTDFAGNSDQGRDLVIQPDGKFVIAGTSFSQFSADFALARYNPDGTLDPSFGTDGKVITDFCESLDIPPALALQANGKLVTGGFTSANSTTDFALARYNPDGTLDTSFGTDGKLTTDFANSFDLLLALDVQADGRLVAAGITQDAATETERFALARYVTEH